MVFEKKRVLTSYVVSPILTRHLSERCAYMGPPVEILGISIGGNAYDNCVAIGASQRDSDFLVCAIIKQDLEQACPE